MNWNTGQWLQSARRMFSSRYVRMLEDEVTRLREDVARERAEIARLRLENRALLNSLLGTAGVPPVEESRSAPQPFAPIRRHFWRPHG